ncbi:FAD-dependent oxidoreductase [Pseudomonas aeruginosa]|nr:FAD-dependent oxidoreductase [Pseudomonas aeruginosa]
MPLAAPRRNQKRGYNRDRFPEPPPPSGRRRGHARGARPRAAQRPPGRPGERPAACTATSALRQRLPDRDRHPGFIRSIAQENVQGAAQKILSANILGGSCARVCPTEILCQRACVRNNAQECAPVLIGQLQRYALDHAGFGEHPFKRSPATGKRIAVVGAGPAGLSCAHRLAMHGHDVVLFEACAKAGGLNEYGIARYKLVDDFARRAKWNSSCRSAVSNCATASVSATTWRSAPARRVRRGVPRHRPGRQQAPSAWKTRTPRLLATTDYIRELRQSDDLLDLPVADRCIVIGAGNTAIDMAVQMSRLRRPRRQPGLPPWLRGNGATGHEQEIAKASQVRLLTWAGPERVLLTSTVGCAACASPARAWRTVAGDTGEHFELAADAIFKAIGQAFEGASLGDPLAAQLRRDGERIQVDGQMRTSIPGIYAGGDCVALGEDLTVQAVQHGKLAAEAIHAQLMLNVEAA